MLKLKDTPETAPTVTDLISLADARTHLRRGNYTGENSDITLYTSAAYDYIRQELKRAILPEVWVGYLTAFPSSYIDIGHPGVTGVTHVKYYDTNAVQQTIAAANYQLDLYSPTSRIHTAADFDWPETEDEKIDPVEVQFTMGWAAADVPANITHAIKLMISYMYDNRGAETVAAGYAAEIPIPKAIANLIERYRSPMI